MFFQGFGQDDFLGFFKFFFCGGRFVSHLLISEELLLQVVSSELFNSLRGQQAQHLS